MGAVGRECAHKKKIGLKAICPSKGVEQLMLLGPYKATIPLQRSRAAAAAGHVSAET